MTELFLICYLSSLCQQINHVLSGRPLSHSGHNFTQCQYWKTKNCVGLLILLHVNKISNNTNKSHLNTDIRQSALSTKHENRLKESIKSGFMKECSVD